MLPLGWNALHELARNEGWERVADGPLVLDAVGLERGDVVGLWEGLEGCGLAGGLLSDVLVVDCEVGVWVTGRACPRDGVN